MAVSVIEEYLYKILSETAAIIARVSTRIYPIEATQEIQTPYIVYERNHTTRYSAMGGDLGLAETVIDVSVWADTFKEAQEIRTLIRGALQRFKGTSGTVTIQDTFITSETDNFDPDINLYETIIQVKFWHV